MFDIKSHFANCGCSLERIYELELFVLLSLSIQSYRYKSEKAN